MSKRSTASYDDMPTELKALAREGVKAKIKAVGDELSRLRQLYDDLAPRRLTSAQKKKLSASMKKTWDSGAHASARKRAVKRR